MGFLTINGMLMTYDEYKSKTKCYSTLGLRQFSKLYSIFKNRQIEAKELHWGEEIEYHLYSLDKETRTVKLCCDASGILTSLDSEH